MRPPFGSFDDVCVEANADRERGEFHLHVAPACRLDARKPCWDRRQVRDRGGCIARSARETEYSRRNVGRANRDDGEGRSCVDGAVGRVVDNAVTTHGSHHGVSIFCGPRCTCPRLFGPLWPFSIHLE